VKQSFEAVLERPEGVGTWTCIDVPFDVKSVFGKSSRIQVRGTIDGAPYRSSLLPKGDGHHFMVVKKEIRDVIEKSAGEKVIVTMEIDATPRVVDVSDDFKLALKKSKDAQEVFNKLSYSHKKEYVEWIESAKKSETREDRIRKAIEMLSKSKMVVTTTNGN
jgi:acetyl-CoA carboxylase beta subunit